MRFHHCCSFNTRDWSIADVNIVKSNFYDEHLFVYLLGRGTKESYCNELHSNLIVNICQDPSKCDHPSNIMFLTPNNIIFSTVLYKFVTDACFRMQIINESWFELLVDYNNEKGLRCELLSMCKKMVNVICEYMAKSLILHVYHPLEKKKLQISNLVWKMLNISPMMFDAHFKELDTSREINNIRIQEEIQTKKAIEASKIGKRAKIISIKYMGMQDLLEQFMELLWDEWQSDNHDDLVDTDMFKEFASHINSKFNYNAYTIDFLTKDQAAKASVFPNEMTKNEVLTHEEVYNDIGSIIKKFEEIDIANINRIKEEKETEDLFKDLNII